MKSRPSTLARNLFDAIYAGNIRRARELLNQIAKTESTQPGSDDIALKDLVYVHDDQNLQLSVLMAAAANPNCEAFAIEVFELLLGYYRSQEAPSGISTFGFTLDTIDQNGSTALMHAVCAGNSNLVRKMLETKACDPTIKNHAGQDALDIARNLQQRDLVRLITPVWSALTQRRQATFSRYEAALKTSYGDQRDQTFFAQPKDPVEPVAKKRRQQSRGKKPAFSP